MGGSQQAVRFPVADLDGQLVWAVDAAGADERPVGLTCVGCGDPIVLRAGALNRPHFAHKSGASCGAGETALHRTAIRVLAESIVAAARARRPFPLEVECEPCQAMKVGNLAMRHDCDIACDQVLEDSIRPDLLIRSADGTPRTVIEVVVTHAPEEQAVTLYARLGFPVVLVWPTWETLEKLRTGFLDESRRSDHNPAGLFDVTNYPCPLPRHCHDAVPSACPDCSGDVLHVSVEVASSTCWSCKAPVAILDIVEHRAQGLRVVAAGCEDLVGVPAVARASGVVLKVGNSNAAGGSYLANRCKRGHLQGDNFVYGSEGVVDVAGTVQHMVVCASGHWTPVGQPRRWPNGSQAERVSPVVGHVGNPAGLFGREGPGDGGLVSFQEVDASNISAIARRMAFGSGGGW